MASPPDYDDSPEDRPRRERDEGPRAPRRTEAKGNGIAVFSLVLGIMSLCGGITALPGIICAVIGMNKAGRTGTGKGIAIAGLITSIVGIPVGIATGAILVGLLLPAVQKTREAASRMQSSNNLKQIGLAMHNYDSANGKLPPQAVCDKTGKKLLSWRVTILPYIEQGYLYSQFKLDEPWDSPTNKPLIAQMPKTFWKANSNTPATSGETYYKVFAGKKTAFALTDETDRMPYTSKWGVSSLGTSSRGTSNLILCVEGGDPVTWTKPDDFDYDPSMPLPDFKPTYSGGLMMLMGDGSVRTLRKGYRESALRASIEPNNPSTEWLDN